MGQAKQRGTFEQRQHAAFDMIDRNFDAAKEATEKMNAEEESAKKLLGMLVTDTLERFDKSGHVLLNADFSQLEERMFSLGYVPGQEYHDERTFIRTGRSNKGN